MIARAPRRQSGRAREFVVAVWNRAHRVADAIERSRRLRLGLVLFIIVYAFAGSALELDKPDVTGDEGSYIPLSFYLYKNGVITFGKEISSEYGVEPFTTDEGITTWPSASRAPAYLWFLATSLHLHPSADSITEGCLRNRVEGCYEIRQDLKLGNVLVFTLLALLTYVLTRQLSESAVAGFIAALLVGSSSSLLFMSDTLRPEVLAAFLVCLSSGALLWAWQRPSFLRCGFTGISFGALALCQPIFLYAIIPVAVILAIRLISHKSMKRATAAACFGIALVGFAVMVGPWLARNYYYHGAYNITNRGAATLRIRAEYNQMTWREYLASFAYWAANAKERSASLLFARDDYRRLDRNNHEDGYYRVGKGGGGALVVEHGLKGRPLRDQLAAEAKAMILADPVKHILVSIPFGWRGLFPETGLTIHPGSIEFSGGATRLILNLIYWGGAVFCVVQGLRRRDYRYLIFATLAFWGWASYAGGSHFVSRYSMPFIPILVILTVTAATNLLSRKIRKDLSPMA